MAPQEPSKTFLGNIFKFENRSITSVWFTQWNQWRWRVLFSHLFLFGDYGQPQLWSVCAFPSNRRRRPTPKYNDEKNDAYSVLYNVQRTIPILLFINYNTTVTIIIICYNMNWPTAVQIIIVISSGSEGHNVYNNCRRARE